MNIKVKRDGHTHPNLLKKPAQADEFVSRAVELGFDEIVFTDHMPFSVTGDEHDRIPAGMVSDYCREVSALRERYADKIRILTGIEIDYRKDCVPEIRDVLSAGHFDIVLGSTHLDIKGFGVPFHKLTRGEFAGMVFENYLTAAESGLFDVITHLDIYRWIFEAPERFPLKDDGYTPAVHEGLLRRIFKTMEKGGISLEFNAAPYHKGFGEAGAYPAWDILRIAADYKLNYTYGSDAHTAHHVGFAYDRFESFMDNK